MRPNFILVCEREIIFNSTPICASVCVCVREENPAPNLLHSHFLCFPSSVRTCFPLPARSLCLVLVFSGFAEVDTDSKVSVEMNPHLCIALPFLSLFQATGFCHPCQLWPRSIFCSYSGKSRSHEWWCRCETHSYELVQLESMREREQRTWCSWGVSKVIPLHSALYSVSFNFQFLSSIPY